MAHFHKDIYGFHSLPFYFRVKQVRRACEPARVAPTRGADSLTALGWRFARARAPATRLAERDGGPAQAAVAKGAQPVGEGVWQVQARPHPPLGKDRLLCGRCVSSPRESNRDDRRTLTAFGSRRCGRTPAADAAPVIDADWTDKDVLGLDHIDRSNRGGRFGQFERAVVIKN